MVVKHHSSLDLHTSFQPGCSDTVTNTERSRLKLPINCQKVKTKQGHVTLTVFHTARI